MTTQQDPLHDTHRQLALLLPWYVNGTLSATERQQIDRHLLSCLQCRRELRKLRKLAAALQQQSNELDIAAGLSFSDLMQKIQKLPPRPSAAVPASAPSRPARRTGLWRQRLPVGPNGLKVLAVAAAVLIMLLPAGMKYWPGAPAADYYTLSAAKPPAAPVDGTQLHMVFAPGLGLAGIDELLASVGAVRSGGPNSAGAYTVVLRNGDPPTAISLLRQQPQVLLVEPVRSD